MKTYNYTFFILFIILSFFISTSVAGRYICVDKNGKEIICPPIEVNTEKNTKGSKSIYRTKGTPAGTPYEHLEDNEDADDKKK